jgi:hypothetical protein
MSLTSLTGQVLTDFLKQLKKVTEEQITLKTENTDSIRAEEKAILHYWKTQKDSWIAKGKLMAAESFDRPTSQKRARDGESQELDDANVSLSHDSISHTHSSPLDIFSPFQKSQEECSQRPFPSPQPRSQHSEWQITASKPSHQATSRVNRRRSNHSANRIKQLHTQLHQFSLELDEFKLEKHNLKRIGVAKTIVHNISGIPIPKEELESLALGIKFIPTPPIKPDVLKDAFEHFCKTVRWRTTFSEWSSEIPSYWIPTSKTAPPSTEHIEKALRDLRDEIQVNKINRNINITSKQRQNLANLLNRSGILVITADKNLGYTVVSTDWYRTRCLEHLESSSYTNCTDAFMQDDFGQTFIAETYNKLRKLVLEFEFILEPIEMKWILQVDDWKPCKFYILAKIHKLPIKGRPIVPSMTWITHHLSEWISNQLVPLLPDLTWVLKDSNDLLKEIHDLNFSHKLKNKYSTFEIYSADVDALYPNMDITTGLELVRTFLEEIDWEDPQRIEFLIRALRFVLTEGYIEFGDQIFQQNNGAAMGSPTIPPYANIYMYMLERQTVEKYSKTSLVLYKRFIDDILIIIETHQHNELAQLQHDLNHLHPTIKLTWAKPAYKCIFLDLSIWITAKNHIHTEVYQKPLNMYSYLPFHSYHTSSQKSGFIKAEALRYSRTCSRLSDFSNMIHLFTIRLQRRGYPLQFINNAIRDVKWQNRIKHLFKPSHLKNEIPLIYKIKYTPTHNHHQLRTVLNNFTARIARDSATPLSIRQRITLCYSLPRKLHKSILKARKAKGF